MRTDHERLTDIAIACQKIAERVAEGRAAIEDDENLQYALVRLVTIIGEAASRLSESFRRVHRDVPWRDLADTRNRLVHGYFDVDLDRLWQIVTKDVVELQTAVERILQEIE